MVLSAVRTVRRFMVGGFLKAKVKGAGYPAQIMKACRGVTVSLHSFLKSTFDAGEWSTRRLRRFKPGKQNTVPIQMGNCVGPRATMEVLETRRVSCTCRVSASASSRPQVGHYSGPCRIIRNTEFARMWKWWCHNLR
jgi:hypothetical protein